MTHARHTFFLATVLGFAVLGGARVEAQPWSPAVESAVGLERSRLGIQVQPMTEELREHFHAPRDRGVLVSQVAPGKPGAEAGVQVGDIILSVDGTPIQRPFDLVRSAARTPEGEAVTLLVVREGEERSIVVKPEGQATPWIDPGYWQEWAQQGLRMGSEELRKQLEQLERRLRDLEKKLDDMNEKSDKDGERT